MDNATLEAKVLSLSTQLVRGILTEYRRFSRRYSTNCPQTNLPPAALSAAMTLSSA